MNKQIRPTLSRARGAGEILTLFRRQECQTRADVMELTGLSRSAVTQKLDLLLEAGYLCLAGETPSTGGRPANRYAFNAEAGYILAAAIGASHFSAVLATFGAQTLAETSGRIVISEGPEGVMPTIDQAFSNLLDRTGLTPKQIKGIALSVPGPVEFAQGRIVNPPIMTGWDGFCVPEWFTERFNCAVLVDNDVNAMAYGEHTMSYPNHPHMLLIKLSTGIGCGIVMGGTLHRGAQGAAGDIGHVPAGPEWQDDRNIRCRCGNVDCVEAYASGWAMIRDLIAEGFNVQQNEDVVALVRAGEPEAIRLIKRASRIVGHAVADAVSFFNPSLVLIGGYYTRVDELILAGIRETVYRRSLPLATKHLEILPSTLSQSASTSGLVNLLMEHILDPGIIEQQLGGSGDYAAR